MTTWSKRGLSALALAAGATLVLTGCLGGASGGGASGEETTGTDAEGPLTIQSRLTAGEAEGLQAVVDAFNEKGLGEVEINEVPANTYREQLPTYLTAANPADIFTWLAGEATRTFADEGLVLDISDIWEDFTFSDAFRELSQDSDGNEVFVPTSNYWWGVYYDTRVFDELGLQEPTTWEEFLAVCEAMESAGITPIGLGLSDTAWMASAWFDYLNMRVNGPEFHLDLLAGEESFDSPEVQQVFEYWDEILPYFDTNAGGLPFQQATTDWIQGRTGMYLAGAWIEFNLPQDELEYFDFFKFPEIDPGVSDGEEAPTDGFFASARTDQPQLAKEFLSYLASAEAQEIMFEAVGSATLLPTNPDANVTLSPVAEKGRALLENADVLTQFFNRDAGDDIQPSADQALTKYLAGVEETSVILEQWQVEAQQARDARAQ
ncbi:carbohydrate ABC transporter substrate-binding protein (CUT1 family) [Microbacterium sp. SLBN-154]|uniref:ABC transporter substrate-binding protein n=1 Tax=Microbacterium sp. SLBN-154 TaxID=2768458 RepID=UPI00114E42A7|nr:extracellular solute-binding protein [Microbacterium sp. SLBN-154]TQK17666.1 carbohydrate ABC transporter substrate-binding protein (CUT1 family) [Microbacterium sp. SLBN-154]